MSTLREDRVYIYAYHILQYPQQQHIQPLMSFLNTTELARYERYKTTRKQAEYLLSRVALKRILSKWAGISFSDIVLEASAFGKPYLSVPGKRGMPGRIRFNVSHSDQIIVCAVALDMEIGVDAQKVDSSPLTLQIANKVFSQREVDLLSSLSGNDLYREFTRIWTLKEAYAKAVGLGLSLPFNQFDVVSDDSYINKMWTLESFNSKSNHFVAVAVENIATRCIQCELMEQEISLSQLQSATN